MWGGVECYLVRPRRTLRLNKHQKDSACSSGPPEEEGGWSADAARSAERRQRGLQSPGPEPSYPPAASMAPQRKSDFSQIVLRALCTGACVSLVNACVAGECRPGGLRTQSRARHWGPGLSDSPWVALRGIVRGWTLPTSCLLCTGILYMPRGPAVDCVSLLNTTLNSSSFEVYQCCHQAFQR